MTEESSTISHLSFALTSSGVTQLTSPSSSRGMEFYFHIALLIIGVIGTAANGLVLYALVVSKQHKKHVLIVNQNALDLFTSLMMVITYTVWLCNIRVTGSAGHWLCMLILSNSLVWCGTIGSVINLACVTVERYLKVVHHAWSKIKLKNWMINSAMAFSWICSFTWNIAFVFSTSTVMYGRCMPYVIWVNATARIVHTIWYFVSFYVIILLIFIFCYWHILIVIRRQAQVMAGHAEAGPSTAQVQSHKMQSSVIKTMIFVSALYAILWFPNHIHILIQSLNPRNPLSKGLYYATVVIAFLYMCTNPFVYATKFDPVKDVLLRLILCKKDTGTVNVVSSSRK